MVIIEFGAAEKQTLDANSLFITFKGEHFQENVAKIKGFWNRICHGKPKWEWETPYSCYQEILELFKGEDIRYLNNPPKAKLVDNDDILNGLDFNGYNLYDYQLDGVKYGVNHYNWLLLDEQGLGKAQPYGSKIYTPSGFVNIEDLKVGDYVLGRNAKTKVIGVYDRGILPVYEIKFSDGSSTRCSNDHLWTITKKLNTTEYYTVDTNYLIKNLSNETFYIPMINKADFDKKDLPLDPYVLGALLGDGNMSKSSLNFTSADSFIVEKLNSLLPEHYYLKFNKHSKYDYRVINDLENFQYTGCYEYIIGDRKFNCARDVYTYFKSKYNIKIAFTTFAADLCKKLKQNSSYLYCNELIYKTKRSMKVNKVKQILDDLKLYNHTSKDKFIPDIYKYNSLENRLALLQGLIDTDGYVNKQGLVEFTSTSTKLLEDVKELCESLGAKVMYRPNMYKHYHKYVTIGISFPDNIVCCTLPRKLARLRLTRNPKCYYKPNRKIKEIKYIGDFECRCIKVDAEDELYITNNFIVTHNTLQSIVLARYLKEHNNLKHCLIVCGVNSLKWNWQREIEKFCKNEKGIVLGTRKNSKGKMVSITIEETKKQIESCPEEFFWIINIEKMRASTGEIKRGTNIINYLNDQIMQKNLGMIIVDEVHKIKNLQSAQATGLMNLDKSVRKMLMTGTLLVNNPYDLYCPMSICGLINYNKWLFEKKFVIKDDWGQILGYQNMDELHDILYKSSLRRTKDLLDLPDKVYKQEWLEFTQDEQDVFDQVTGNKPFNLDKIDEPMETVAIITRMRQATVAAGLLTSKKVNSTKFERLNDILEEARLNRQKVLVFCPFTEALKLGLEYCKEYRPKLVCGGMGTKIQEVVDEHENTDGFSVLFAQEATLGVGFTLTNTEICVFLSPPWNRATYDQCSDRIHRIGQKHTVQIIDLLIKDTYDELIYKKLHGKGAMSDVIIDGDESKAVMNYIKDMNIEFHKKTVEEDKPKTLLDGVLYEES